MRRMKRLLRAIVNVLRRSQLEHDLDAEVRTCIDLLADEHVARGVPAPEARRLAYVEIGGLEQTKLRVRESRAGASIEQWMVDVTAAVRAIRRAPGFAFAVVLAMALGIGVNVAMFGVIDSLLLRALPYRNAERLFEVRSRHPQAFARYGRGGFDLSPPELAASPAFAAIALHASGALNVGDNPPERVSAAAVTSRFWDALRPPVRLGRTFTPADVSESPHVAVVGHHLWQRRFGADPAVLGRSIVLNGRPYVIVGVVAERVSFPNGAEVWIPAAADNVQLSIVTPRVLARLADAVTPQQAADEVVRTQNASRPGVSPFLPTVTPLRTALTASAQGITWLVTVAALLVLIVGTSNAANLLSTQVARREREFSVRSALGASRARIMRQVFLEAGMLSVLSSVAAVLSASWTLSAIRRLLPPSIHGVADLHVDARLIVAAASLALASALLFGLAPALSVPGRGVVDVLRGGRATAIDPFWRRLRSALVIGQIALALVVLSATWTVVSTVSRFLAVDLGARGENAVIFEFVLPEGAYNTAEKVRSYYERLAREIQALPGVAAVGMTNRFLGQAPPLSLGTPIQSDGMSPVEGRSALHLMATPGFFEAASIDLIAGRTFTDRDAADAPRVAIVNREYVRALQVIPTLIIGQRVRVDSRALQRSNASDGWAQVVGIVGDVRLDGPESQVRPLVYVPLTQDTRRLGQAGIGIVKTHGARETIAAALQKLPGRVDPTVPVFAVRTFDERVRVLLGERRFARSALIVFGGLASMLAALGLYAVLAYAVQARTRELGIRIAIGARPTAVRRQVLRLGLLHAVAGVLVGCAGAWAAMKYGVASVAGLQQLDAAGVAWIALGLVVVAAAASWLPAYRASRVDPVRTLRVE